MDDATNDAGDKRELLDGLREMVFAMRTVLYEGIFDDGAQTEGIGMEAIDGANDLLERCGGTPVTMEEWEAERDA